VRANYRMTQSALLARLDPRKTGAAVGAGLVPIVCVGETGQECELGETERRLRDQLQSGLALVDTGRLGEVVIAHEPLWTIGTGRLAACAHIQLVGAFLRGLVADRSGEQAARIRVLYCGSISPESSAALLELDEVDGLLVGEASLRADSFAVIVDTARRLSPTVVAVHAGTLRGRP
jgi:triosephosphate isomerase